ncbi:MAG: sulfite exporter TauE/SafE family protein [Magnetococcales bacterium]|nr:sulfite exporter TauE/SafE family protein [Magnetococcales bacterium]MBF0113789.1 sulfite exporter TauE/SafE family protein [Magnetococcales bacterium]
MPVELLSALMLGFSGSIHCLAMCGSILAALSVGLPAPVRADRWRFARYLLAFAVGRISAYALLGWLAGAMAIALPRLLGEAIRPYMQALASLALLLTAAHWLGWRSAALERLGSPLWRLLEPWARRLLPVQSPVQALLVGFIWGWVPCGLVYTMAIWSALRGGGAEMAALSMLVFGVGTLPFSLAGGVVGGLLAARSELVHLRYFAAGLLILVAVGGGIINGWPELHRHFWYQTSGSMFAAPNLCADGRCCGPQRQAN